MVLTLLAGIAALVSGLAVVFLFFGLSRLSKNYQQQAAQRAFLENITRSEIEIERAESGALNPRTWTGYWATLAQNGGIKFKKPENAGLSVAGLTLLAFLVGFFVYPRDIFGGLLLGAATIVVIRIVFRAAETRRIQKLEKQLPALLSGLRASLQAQNTPQQALVEQAETIPSPLGDDLKLLRDDINVNIPLDMALANFQQRVPSREVRFLVAAVRIAINSGSDLEPLIIIIQDIVVQRTRIANQLAAAVAQVQPALWVTGVMIPAGFIFSFYSSDTNRQFWGSLLGLGLLVVIGGLYALGLFLARKQIQRVKNA